MGDNDTKPLLALIVEEANRVRQQHLTVTDATACVGLEVRQRRVPFRGAPRLATTALSSASPQWAPDRLLALVREVFIPVTGGEINTLVQLGEPCQVFEKLGFIEGPQEKVKAPLGELGTHLMKPTKGRA